MLALLALATATLSACGPATVPEPTPTAAFASEEEAFAAAEETYRAYTDALIDIDLDDPDSLETLYAWLAEDAESTARETFSTLAADDFTVSGVTAFQDFNGMSADPSIGDVSATVCLNVTDVDVLDSSGRSIVSEDRPDLQPLLVEFSRAPTSTGLAIVSTQPSDELVCAL